VPPVDGVGGGWYGSAMRSLGKMWIGALALAACGARAKPVLDAEDLPRNAAEVVAVYNDWDAARLAALYKQAPALEQERAEFEWLRERLGACEAPTLMWRSERTRGRFSASCERGELQISMRLDKRGRVKGTILSAAGVEAPAQVTAAQREVVAAMPFTQEIAGAKPWGKALRPRWARALGRCEVAGVRSVGARTGRYDLRCEHGAALLKLELAGDGSIAQVWLWKSDDDRTRAFAREMLG
jgi:hypothetical protein